jgi:muramidase (phage lysozyme)
MQDRLAVAILESKGALPFVRTGNIQEAVNKITGRWSSLPGGKHNLNRKTPDGKPMDMNYFTALFNTYLNEEMKKENWA